MEAATSGGGGSAPTIRCRDRQRDNRLPHRSKRWQLLALLFVTRLCAALCGLVSGAAAAELNNTDQRPLLLYIPMHVSEPLEQLQELCDRTLSKDPWVAGSGREQKKTKKTTSIHSPLTSCSSSVGPLTPLATPRCRLNWKEFCIQRVLPKETFFERIREFPFIKCVHGGGLDPSPKAFEALLSGTIPIIQHYAGDDAYRELPVVFVDDWEIETITAERLATWRDKLTPYFEQRELRADVLHRLTSAYWWGKVESVLHRRPQGVRNSALAIEGRETESAKEWE